MCEHLVDAPLRGDVEAVLSRGEALHLQDLSGDRRRQEDVGLRLFEGHHVVDRLERKTLGCRNTPADIKPDKDMMVGERHAEKTH